MTFQNRLHIPRWVKWSLSTLAILLIPIIGVVVSQQDRITKYLEGPSFRAELDKQTSKGLHFQGKYEPLTRIAPLTAKTDGFKAVDGEKAFESLTAEGITGTFNPWGVFLRRWQIDSIHIDKAKAVIQTYEPKPQNKPPKPWYAIFMPDRVYLKEVRCDDGDIVWKLNGKEAGFIGAKVLLTPHGRDFEYRISDGEFVIPSLPRLPLKQAHALITKERLSLYEISLLPKGGGAIKLQGYAGLKGDKSMHLQLDIDKIPISPWIPTSWGDQVKGRASGYVTCDGPDQKIESTTGNGEINLSGARILSIPFLDYAASATQNSSLKNIALDDCVITFSWKNAKVSVTDILIEAKGQFKIQGTLQLSKSNLSGELSLGVSEKNLDWLPKAKEEIFTKEKSGYLWTKVNLSGTLQEPQNDLAPRIAKALKRSPAESTGLLFRQIGEWFKQTLGND